MIFAGIDVNIITHEKALAAGVEAMGLWLWGMCYAQSHQTNGRLARIAVLTAMAGKRNASLAQRLVDAGLWLVDESGWRIWNYDKKNQTAEEIAAKQDAKKAANAERQRRARERAREASQQDDVTHVTRDVTRDSHVSVTPRNGPTTTTTTTTTTTKPDLPSGGGERARPGLVKLDLPLAADAERVWEQRTFSKSAGKPISDVWSNFLGHFAAQDFQTREGLLGRWSKWVDKQCDIAAKERQESYDRADRQRARHGPPEPSKITPEQSKAFAEQLAARVAARKAKGAA